MTRTSNNQDSQRWPVQDAKAKFSELVKRALRNEDLIVTHRGTDSVVVISKKRYDALTAPRSSTLDFFREAPLPDLDLDLSRADDFTRDIDL